MSSCNSVECCNSVEALLERTGGNYPNGGKKEGVVMGLYTAHDRAIKRIPDYFYTAFAGELLSVYGWSRSRDMFYPDSTPELYNIETGESVDEGQKSGRKRSVSQQK